MEPPHTPVIIEIQTTHNYADKLKQDIELMEHIFTCIWSDRRLFKHGCFIAPDHNYGDMESLHEFFSYFDELGAQIKKYDRLDISALNKCLGMYQRVCIRIKARWLVTINEDSICEVTATCKVCHS